MGVFLSLFLAQGGGGSVEALHQQSTDTNNSISQQSIGMVLRLEPLVFVEDWQARAGLILAALEADPDTAEALLLKSRTPAAAVALRRDVQHWDRALVLAQQLQPDMVGYLSCRRAQELEVEGSFDAALLHYEAALTATPPEALQVLSAAPPAGTLGVGGAREDAYVWACQAGKARCAVHEGAVDLVRPLFFNTWGSLFLRVGLTKLPH